MTWTPTRLTRAQMAERRREGARLLRRTKLSQAAIARRLAVSRAAVGQWAKDLATGGLRQLAARRRTPLQVVREPAGRVGPAPAPRRTGGGLPHGALDGGAGETGDRTGVHGDLPSDAYPAPAAATGLESAAAPGLRGRARGGRDPGVVGARLAADKKRRSDVAWTWCFSMNSAARSWSTCGARGP